MNDFLVFSVGRYVARADAAAALQADPDAPVAAQAGFTGGTPKLGMLGATPVVAATAIPNVTVTVDPAGTDTCDVTVLAGAFGTINETVNKVLGVLRNAGLLAT